MNADTTLLDEGINNWGLTDIKTDSRLFDQDFDDQLEWSVETKPLLCLLCSLEFVSYSQYTHHHLQHVALPSVVLTPIVLNSDKPYKKRPGPKCKTENHQPHSPLKLTFKRLPTCHEPAFKVVSKKKGKIRSSASMDEMIREGGGETSPLPNSHTPSPTPSDILRTEVNAEVHTSTWESLAYSFGFLAPETLEPPADQVAEETLPAVNGTAAAPENDQREDSGASSAGDEAPMLPPPEPVAVPQENGVSEMDSEPDTNKNVEQESSDSGCEKDGSEKEFVSAEKNSEPEPPPPNPSPVSTLNLKILAPSALNSSVVNGSLPSEPLDSNAVLETLSTLNEPTPTPPPPPPVREGLTIKSPAALGATSSSPVNLLNLNSGPGGDPMGMLRGFMSQGNSYMPVETCEVCGDRSDNLEAHRAAMGHYKCHISPDCAVVLFTSASDLRNHQHVAHGIIPSSTPPPQQSLQQLAQQVQRLPVPYGGVTMPTGVPTPPPPISPQNRSTPTIQARPFAMATSPSTMRPDGSPVSSPALPPSLGRSISISAAVKATPKRPPSPPTVDSFKRSRAESPDCEFVDVQQKMPTLPRSISLTVRGSNDAPAPPKETSGVANILASRGITVTPSVNKPSPQPSSRASVTAQPVTSLNLGSAVSIVPASQARSQFAVPTSRNVSRAQSTVRPPTVDLTQDSPPSFSRRNRPQRFPCQVCDKVFTSQETLNQHLTTHRSPGKLPYKCSLCNAQYPTHQALLQHKQTYHKEAQGSEMALPVVDLKHPGTVQKLSSLGIRHCLVLSQLTNSSGGVFGLPIVAIDSARNPAVCNLAALGASNVLSLGPAKALR